MRIKWLGHSSFLITSSTGVKIITDPYKTGGNLTYGEIKESADIVTVSHEHFDHNNAATVGGNPAVVKGTSSVDVKGIHFEAIPAFHDQKKGAERGANTIFCFEVDGMRVCHLGDLGHPLGDKEISKIGKVDILFVPVGGFYTIDAATATDVVNKVAPRVAIPMHYKNLKCQFPITPIEDFLKGKHGVSQRDVTEVEFKKGGLPEPTQIVVLKSAM